MTTPEPSAVSVTPVDTGLRERIAETLKTCHMHPEWPNARHDEHIRDGACHLCRGDVDALTTALVPVFEQAHGDLVAKVAEQHEIIQGWARYGERVKADRVRFGDMLIAALGLQDERVGRHFHHLVPEACKEIARLRAELGDLRFNLSQRAFTAPDADDATMLSSLDARIADAVASRSTPALPDGAAEKRAAGLRLWSLINDADHEFVYEFGGGPSPAHDKLLAVKEFTRTLAFPSSPATDPEPATPDGQEETKRPHEAVVDNAVAGALIDVYGFVRLDVRYEAAEAARRVVERWLSFGQPVAPQAPAEPTDEGGHRVGVKRSADDRLLWAANCKDCSSSYGGNAKEVADWAVEHTIATTPPAGPAVPEDTATRPWTAHEVEVKNWYGVSVDWTADCKTCPEHFGGTEQEVNDWADSHRADTTRPTDSPSTSTPKEA
jgi:hypothetical protein